MSAAAAQSACARCGAAFTCGMVAGTDACWCAAMPHLDTPDYNTTCMCAACLQQILEKQERNRAAPSVSPPV